MRHGDDRQAGRRQPRQIAKDVPAADKILHAVAQQIGARAFDQLHVRQLVFQRQFLHPQRLVEAVRLQRAGVDLSKPETVRAVVDQLDRLVTQLEGAIAKLPA